MRTKELYSRVTQDIVSQLEKGVRPWTKAWSSTGGKSVSIMPSNIASGRSYSGINILLLWGSAMERGFPSHGWMTFKQANEKGGKVRKGEKATTVVYTNFRKKDDDENSKPIPFLKTYSVFNLAQIDGLPESPVTEEMPEDARLDGLRELLKASGIKVLFGAGEPAYYPSQDHITMPAYGDFKTDHDFASTLGHELIHAVGHPKRLDRKFENKLWKERKAAEECVAELGSAFLCAHLGFDYIEAQSPAYIENWLSVLKHDDRCIFSLASYASHAADWLRERVHAVTDETPAVERAA